MATLVRWDQVTEAAYLDYVSEWEATGQKIVPSASDRRGRTSAEMRARWAEAGTDLPYTQGFVPATLFFFVDRDGRILGSAHLRHALNDRLLVIGGHIGFGVRPSERGRGWGIIILKALLDTLDPGRFPRLLVTCDDDNAASAATIEACGGVLEDRREVVGVWIRRYWITLPPTSR